MKTCNFIIILIIISHLACISWAQIHRAQPRQYNKPSRPVFDDEDLSPPGVRYPYEDHNTPAGVSGPKIEPNQVPSGPAIAQINYDSTTWIYSLVSAALVGLSGIFPLLLIRITDSSNENQGKTDGDDVGGFGGCRLKQLLSFAVGGLLGDVFLQLLPETWANIQSGEELRSCGLWVIVGFLSFLLIEKIFPDKEEEEEQEQEQIIQDLQQKPNTSVSSSYVDHSPSSDKKKKNKSKSNPSLTNGNASYTNGTNGKIHKNGVQKLTNGTKKQNHSNGTNGTVEKLSNGVNSVKNGVLQQKSAHNGVQANGKHVVCHPEKPATPIKTSGWLNLLANVIDNSTHGLAVAASYSVSTKTGLLTTAAVLLHEVPHEIGDFAILLRSGFDRWKAAQAQLVTATGGICGAFVALCASSVQEAGNKSSWMLPFTSGGFLYIALVTVLPDLLSENNRWESLKQMLLLLLGISVMSLSIFAFNQQACGPHAC